MNGWFQYFKDVVVIVEAICVIAATISTAVGILRGFPVEGIIAALIIIAAGIFWRYHIRIIRKKDDEIVSLRKQIKQAEPPVQKSNQDVCGTYEAKGKHFQNAKKYSGEFHIKEVGEVLSGTWEIGSTKEGVAPEQIKGTGLLVDNALAFTFDYTDKEGTTKKGTTKKGTILPGVGLYVIKSDGSMSGRWTVRDESSEGVENCSKERA